MGDMEHSSGDSQQISGGYKPEMGSNSSPPTVDVSMGDGLPAMEPTRRCPSLLLLLLVMTDFDMRLKSTSVAGPRLLHAMAMYQCLSPPRPSSDVLHFPPLPVSGLVLCFYFDFVFPGPCFIPIEI